MCGAGSTAEEAAEFFSAALSLQPGPLCFNMDSDTGKAALADACWSAADFAGDQSTSTQNAQLKGLFEVLMHNTYRPVDLDAYQRRTEIQLEGIMANLVRGQSQKILPLLTARCSLVALRAQVPRLVWQMLSTIAPGLFASFPWTEEFAELGSKRRPPISYASLPGVGGVIFDNYSRKVLYSSQATVESHGYLLNMTNWAKMQIPRSLASPNFDATKLCNAIPCMTYFSLLFACFLTVLFEFSAAGTDPFRSMSMAGFTSLFLSSNPEICANKRKRFTNFLRATAAGTLFERPSVRPTYVAHLEYQSPPMWGVLQSSYDDVEAELNVMRNSELDKKILFVGGDGLSILRMNHLLVNHPDLYLDSAPMVIPVQGEAPHGVFHVMHGCWRLYVRFIRAAADATLGQDLGRAVVNEPTVKVFNTQIFALWWMTRACSEYLNMISNTPGGIDIDLVPEFGRACERNLDLAWVFHFLYDFAYLVLDFKQGVRANKSTHLDLLWREFYSIGRTGTANKTHYVPMAVMRVFWSAALVPDLAQLYHNLRAIPVTKNTFVGWDTPIEWLNGAITAGVHSHVSEQKIQRFISQYSFLESNYASMTEMMEVARSAQANMKELDGNVNCMKGWLIDNIGADWATATQPNQNSKLGIRLGNLPWNEVAAQMAQGGAESVPAHVARHVRSLTYSFYAFR